jgi:hypothetical protein
MADTVETHLLDRPAGYEARRQAIIAAVRVGQLKGTLCRRSGEKTLPPPIDSIDAHESTVGTASLRAWLKRAARSDLPTNEMPEYLDPADPKYSPLFAAAVRARAAVDVKPEGMTVKQALTRYVAKHEANLSAESRRSVVKVVNWHRKGGAPSTPGGRKPDRP